MSERQIRELLAEVGPRVEIEPWFRCDYGSHIRVGDGFHATGSGSAESSGKAIP